MIYLAGRESFAKKYNLRSARFGAGKAAGWGTPLFPVPGISKKLELYSKDKESTPYNLKRILSIGKKHLPTLHYQTKTNSVVVVAIKGAIVIITIESLDTLFKNNSQETPYSYQGICHNCRCLVEVKITKTSSGYGLEGGILYETAAQRFMIICSDCFEDGKKEAQMGYSN